jgi:hypothetical protein
VPLLHNHTYAKSNRHGLINPRDSAKFLAVKFSLKKYWEHEHAGVRADHMYAPAHVRRWRRRETGRIGATTATEDRTRARRRRPGDRVVARRHDTAGDRHQCCVTSMTSRFDCVPRRAPGEGTRRTRTSLHGSHPSGIGSPACGTRHGWSPRGSLVKGRHE